MRPDLLGLQSGCGQELIMTNGVTGGLGGLLAERSGGVPRRRYKRYTTGTYIGLIAYAIQDSPDKMLTFKQVTWPESCKSVTYETLVSLDACLHVPYVCR